jgi:hypothetical protein
MGRAAALVAAVGAVSALLAGCSGDDEPVLVGPSETPSEPPAYDAELEPAAAVLAIVPADATVLEVTDFEQVRYQLGFGELSSESDRQVLERFGRTSRRQAPLLSDGILRDSGYAQRFGFTQDDVSWEAHFDGPSGEGYVVKFRDDLDMRGVQRAAAAPDGPLAGATVVPSVQIAALGATREPEESWAADPALVALVGPVAGATYVSRSCVEPDEVLGAGDLAPTPDADLDDLEELGPFSVSFGGRLVTVRLGPLRTDVFERARLAEKLPATEPELGEGYGDPVVADPQGGRIGFQLGDGPVAARLAHERRLPFALCGGG